MSSPTFTLQKRTIREKLFQCICGDTISKVELEKLLKDIDINYPNHSNIELEMVEYGNRRSYAHVTRITVYGSREETDEELAIRYERAKANNISKKQKKENELRERELAELARLKAKYENVDSGNTAWGFGNI
jgi:hypothetical protein